MKKTPKPDQENNAYNELEERVDALMSTERPDGSKKIIDPTPQEPTTDNFLPSAPDLPMDKGKLEIKIVRPNSDDTNEEPYEIVPPQLKDEAPEDTPTSAGLSEEDATVGAIEAPETDEAVKDIVAQEGDEVLAKADKKTEAQSSEKKSLAQKIKDGWCSWWSSPTKRNLTLFSVAIALFIIGIIPTTRYFALNSLGVRSSTSVIILDESSQQPLRNVEVRIDEISSLSDETGRAELRGVKLGKQEVEVKRRAFAEQTIDVTLGWGSNPLGEYWLKPTGTQYVFLLDDFLSGEPITEAEVISDDDSAFADETGLVRLTIAAENDAPEIDIELHAEGYRTEKLLIDADTTQQQEISMVARLRHFFTSQRDGKYDIYAVDADGKNETVVLPATGSEREDMTLLAHPQKDVLAVISTRDNVRNADGFLLSSLTVVDTEEENTTVVSESERIQLVGWFEDRLVFIRIAAGASGTNPQRHRLISYDYSSDQETELASSNYFNGVTSVGEYIYYAPSSIFQEGTTSLYRIKADGSDQQTVLSNETWGLFRTSFNTLSIATNSKWYDYDIESGETERLEGEPANLYSSLYIQNPWNDALSLRVDKRDGQGVVLLYDAETGDESVLLEKGGVGYPLRWLNASSFVYRLETIEETADYVMSAVKHVKPQKIQNVAPSNGLERWYSH